MKKNKILVADWHLKVDTIGYLDKLFQHFTTHNFAPQDVDLVVLGDIYDGKAIIRSEVQNYLIDTLQKHFQKFDQIYFIVGNHDLENLESHSNSLQVLEHVVDNLKVIDYDHVDVFDECLMIPYVKDNATFEYILRQANLKSVRYILTHQAFNGFKYNDSGIVCDNGLNINLIPNNIKVFTGHFHTQQQNQNVQYIGSCWSTTFSEANQLKSYWVLKDQHLFQQSIHGLPAHRSIIVNVGINFDPVKEEINNYLQPLLYNHLHSGDHVSLLLIGKKDEVDKIATQVKLPVEVHDFRIKLSYNEERANVLIDESMSLVDMFTTYVDTNKKQYGNVDLKQLKALGQKYILDMQNA